METKTEQATITPPKLFESLSQGLNTVAGNFYLLLMPILLDLFIWLGPRLNFQAVLNNLFASLNSNLNTYPDMADVVSLFKSMEQTIGNLNFFSLLRSVPIGLPSIMAFTGDTTSPLPGSLSINIGNSSLSFVLALLLLSLVGVLLGSVYFGMLARATDHEKNRLPLPVMLKHYFHSLCLTLAVIVMLLVVSIPVSLFANFIAVIAPGIYSIAIYVIVIFIIWLLLPIVFSAHGIYTDDRNVLQSISISIRFVRSNMSGTGIFVLTAVLINMGLNILWQSPSTASWLKLAGIFGHAFIYTSLLAASFIYYRNGLNWMKEKIRRSAAHSRNVHAK